MTARIVRLQGGLGNQLFQLAHALNLTDKFGTRGVILDTGSLARVGEQRSLEVEPQAPGLRARQFPPWIWSHHLPLAQYEDSPGSKARRFMGTMGIALHCGYWQSRIQVDSVRESMFSYLMRERIRHAPRMDMRQPYVAVHIRLGDFVRDPRIMTVHGATRFHDQIDLARATARSLDLDRILIFTDSPELVRPHISESPDLEWSTSRTAWQTLMGMAHGRALIMANSTLSWWSAILAEWSSPEEHQVHAPLPWLAEPSELDRQLISPDWHVYHRALL